MCVGWVNCVVLWVSNVQEKFVRDVTTMTQHKTHEFCYYQKVLYEN